MIRVFLEHLSDSALGTFTVSRQVSGSAGYDLFGTVELMIGLPRGLTVFICGEPVDMRKSFDTLSALVSQ